MPNPNLDPKIHGDASLLENVMVDPAVDPGSNWIVGHWRGDPGVALQIKLFAQPSQFGINGGRISKLFARDERTRETILNYDRGWDVPGSWVDDSDYSPDEWQEMLSDPEYDGHYDQVPDPRAQQILDQVLAAFQVAPVEEAANAWPDALPPNFARVARDTVRCPNCGTDDIETEVCPHCNKPLSVEWRKLESESPYYDSPPQHQHESPFWSEPNRVDKPQAERVDNSYPSILSHAVTDEEFWGNPEAWSGGVTPDEFL